MKRNPPRQRDRVGNGRPAETREGIILSEYRFIWETDEVRCRIMEAHYPEVTVPS